MNVLLSALSGLLLALAFPKFSLWPLAWVALAPFFYALGRARGLRGALACGLWFGLVFFGINLFWITSLTRFAGWWAVSGWLGLVLSQTLFILLYSMLYTPLTRFARPFTASLLWIAIEWLRALGPFGITGGDVGYSQAHFLPLVQIASFAQVYGVSFLVVFFNAALAELCLNRKRWKSFGIAILLVVLALAYGYTTIRRSSFEIRNFPRLALIQPNIDQFDKMETSKVMEIYDIHDEMTRQAAADHPEFIIWPETSVFTFLMHNPGLLPRVRKLAQETGAWLLIGTPNFDDRGRAFNSLVALSPSGEVVSTFNKEKLVPFGEYLPFRALLYPWLKGTGYFDATFNAGEQPQGLAAGGKEIAAAICFESTFPDLIKRRVAKDSDFILTVTNDGWFGASAAPYQHFEAGVFRAVENRKYFVQVGNTGFSGVIDPYGRVLKIGELNRRAVIYF